MIFIELSEVLELHERVILRYGGIRGIRDKGGLQSALVVPQNRLWYEGVQEIATLAAAYAYHLTKAHAFIDGNKRVAAVSSIAFVLANDGEFNSTEDELVELFMQIAASQMSREDVELFFRNHVVIAH